LPDIDLEWGDAAAGAVGTTVLHELGRLLIGVYVRGVGVSAAYSAATIAIAAPLWIYYSAQVLLLGAEFTKIYAMRRAHGEHAQRKIRADCN